MSAFTSQQPKCPICGADAWKSTKHCPFCETLLWNEDGSAVSPAPLEQNEVFEVDTDAFEQFESEAYSFQSAFETQETEQYDIPAEPEEPAVQEVPVAPVTPEIPVIPVTPIRPAIQVTPNVPEKPVVQTKPVEQPVQKNVQTPVDIFSSANPSSGDASIGLIFFLIIWVIIAFNVIISLQEPGFFVFGLAFFVIGGWIMVKKIRSNKKTIAEVKKGHTYEATVLEHLEVKEHYSDGNRRGNTVTYKMRVRTYIYGRETRILLIVKNKNAKLLYPKGSKVQIIGDGYMWLLQDDIQ